MNSISIMNAQSPTTATNHSNSIEFQGVLDTVEKEFPELRKPVEIMMSAVGALSLKDLGLCPAVMLEGEPSSRKTTTLNFFDCVNNLHRTDDFTPASFVSMDASKELSELKEEDLLPKLKGKVFRVSDMNTVFNAGNSDATRDRLSTLSRVLDGDGYSRDSGSHDHREYVGDYKFSMICASTPLSEWHFKVMGNIGSRILIVPLESEERSPGDIGEEVVYGDPYPKKVERCREAVSGFINDHFRRYGVRQTGFTRDATPKRVAKRLGRVADWILRGRDGNENPLRTTDILHHIAMGHALLNGRRHLTEDDIDIFGPVIRGSIPKLHRRIIAHVVRDGRITRKEIEEELDVSKGRASGLLKLLESYGILRIEEEKVRGGKRNVGRIPDDRLWIKKFNW